MVTAVRAAVARLPYFPTSRMHVGVWADVCWCAERVLACIEC